MTPTNFSIRKASSQGSKNIPAILVDLIGVYVQRGGYRLFQLQFNANALNYEYGSTSLAELIPDIGKPGIVRIAVQRQPDTRIHCVRSDGTAAVLVFDSVENVTCWVNVETQGSIEDVAVLPSADGEQDDRVYYVVKRTINGSTVRYLEKWAQETECRGDQALCKLADSFIAYSGVAAKFIPVAHLEGKQVVVWADGADVGTDSSGNLIYTVSGGQIVLATAASNVVIGLPYEAPFKSAKVGMQNNGSTLLNRVKKINAIGFTLADAHTKGIAYGPDFDTLDDMPLIERGAAVGDAVVSDYEEKEIPFPGEYNVDTRICLLAKAPRPCTVLAVTIDYEAGQ